MIWASRVSFGAMVKSEPGPPMTLGNAAAARVRLIAFGGQTTVLDWKARLVCAGCGSRNVEMVVSGTKRR
jgi:hypothetical protein